MNMKLARSREAGDQRLHEGISIDGSVAGGGAAARKLVEPRTLSTLLLRAAKREESGITFIEGKVKETFVSYRTLLDTSCRRLDSLQQWGCHKGDFVMLAFRNNREFLTSFWAVVLGGMVPVPVAYPSSLKKDNYPLRKLEVVWNQLMHPLLLTDLEFVDNIGSVREVLGEMKTTIVAIEHLPTSKRAADPVLVDETDLAMIQYSSGSTGNPKGVMLTHSNLLANIEATVQVLRLDSDVRFFSWMPYHHDMGLIGFHFTPLAVTASQFNLSPLKFMVNPILWLAKVHQHRVTHTGSPNFGYRHVLAKLKAHQLAEWDLSCLRLIFNGAEPISERVMTQFMNTLAVCNLNPTAMYPVYGMAEACLGVCFPPLCEHPLVRTLDRTHIGVGMPIATLSDSTPDRLDIVDEGYPLPGLQIRVVDDGGDTVPQGVIGHVQISGSSVTSGYVNNPSATAHAFQDHWLKTGDLGFMFEGRVSITGRVKDIIFVNGQNYFAHDIESQAESVADIAVGSAAACGWHDADHGIERVVLFVAKKSARKANERQVLIQLAAHINQTIGLALDYCVIVEKIPRTTSGKIKRHQLLEEFQQGHYREHTLSDKELRKSPCGLSDGSQEPVTDEERRVRKIWAVVLKRVESAVPCRQPFLSLGGTSLKAAHVLEALEQEFELSLSHDILLRCHTIQEMAEYVVSARTMNSHRQPTRAETVKVNKKGASSCGSSDIAIVAMGCRFPGASTVDRFWHNLINGVMSIHPDPSHRWPHWSQKSGETAHAAYGGFLDEPFAFDPAVFGLTEADAVSMDPQQRLALHVAWETLEQGGYSGSQRDEHQIGVFLGASYNAYLENYLNAKAFEEWQQLRSFRALAQADRDALRQEWQAHYGLDDARIQTNTAVDNLLNMIASRISHILDLKGPSFTVDSACSSSLVAVHLACESLRRGECTIALAGGVSLAMSSTPLALFKEAGALSPDNQIRVFDADANGFVLGEGVGMVLLKPLDEALKDHDPVVAVVKGSAINNDGRSIGAMAPNPDGQCAVIAKTYRTHDLDPRSIQYMEAHGTGTSIGDLSEVRALTQAFSDVPYGQCHIGSVKSNIGHLLSAAGIAGLIKLSLMLQHKQFPASVNLTRLNPLINFPQTPFMPLLGTQTWPQPTQGHRRAAINSFGFGGTNCHLVVEEAPVTRTTTVSGGAVNKQEAYLIGLSAQTKDALNRRMMELRVALQEHPDWPIQAVSKTLNIGRHHFLPYRAAYCVSSREQFIRQLGELKSISPVEPSVGTSRCFLFTGQGAQYPGMAVAMYERYPRFAELIEQCIDTFDPLLEVSLRTLVLDPSIDATMLAETNHAQPAMFAMGYALGRFLMDCGVQPTCLIGHSIGEFVAACLANIIELDAAAVLVSARGRLMAQQTPPGGMTAVFTTAKEAQELIASSGEELWIAGYNGPHQVVAGNESHLARFEHVAQHQGKMVKRLRVSRAFHTPLMKTIVPAFREICEQVTYRPPQIPIVSNVTGQWLSEQVSMPVYWANHILEPVRFEQSIRYAESQGITCFIECGPDRILASLTSKIVAESLSPVLHLMNRKQQNLQAFFETLKSHYEAGRDLRWATLENANENPMVSLPTYPFEERVYRVGHCAEHPTEPLTTSQSRSQQERSVGPVEESVKESEKEPEKEPDGLHVWQWSQQGVDERRPLSDGAVVVFHDSPALFDSIAKHEALREKLVISVGDGRGFQKHDHQQYRMDFHCQEHYVRLLDALHADEFQLAAIIMCLTGTTIRDGAELEQLTDSWAINVYGMHMLYQVLLQSPHTQQHPLVLQYVTNQAYQAMSKDQLLDPTQAGGHSMASAIAREHPLITVKCVDISVATDELDSIGQAIVAELESAGHETEIVAWREGQRYICHLHPLVPTVLMDASLPFQTGDVVLITGGLTGIGAETALWLARQRSLQLVLIGRQVLPSRSAWENLSDDHPCAARIQVIHQLESLGSTVHYYAANVASLQDMQRCMQNMKAEVRTLDGVIHAAGVVDQTTIRLVQKTEVGMQMVCAPKVQGTIILDRLTRDLPLKCFVLYSSISASFRELSGGVADYAAANAFLDAFSLYRQQRERPGFSLAINWGLWDDCGMGTDQGLQVMVRAKGIVPLTKQKALANLGKALSQQTHSVVHVFTTVDAQTSAEVLRCNVGEPQSSVQARHDSLASESLETEGLRACSARDMVADGLKTVLGKDSVVVHDGQNFQELGVDSASAVSLANLLSLRVGRSLSPTLLFEYQTPDALAKYLNETLQCDAPVVPAMEQQDVVADAGRALNVDHLPSCRLPECPVIPKDVYQSHTQNNAGRVQDVTASGTSSEHDVAIIGMACRLPGARNVDDYWDLLYRGENAITEVPSERWSMDEFFKPEARTPYSSYSKWGGFIDSPFAFEPQFFGISPKETIAMDPQQRVFLEVAWEALQQAGYGGEGCSRNTGIFVGCEDNTYGQHFSNSIYYEHIQQRLREESSFHGLSTHQRAAITAVLQRELRPAQLVPDAVAGNGLNQIAARVSHWLDLRGPNLVVNTACSSALVAVHLGCESLKRGEADMVIVGGVSLILNPMPFIFLSQVNALSPDGRCAPFDQEANGMVLGEGAASLVLKPLSQARADGDYIHAVIKGTAVNNDGHSSGLTAPNPAGQAEVIRRVYTSCALSPESISYIECHGTATPLGDPVEVEGLTQAFRSFTKRQQFCGIGSVKSSIGHLLSASGIPSMMKVILAMKHKLIPGTVNCQTPNSYIDFEHTPFYPLGATSRPWMSEKGPLRGAVNAFGFGGTNVHVILEQAPSHQDTRMKRDGPQLLCLMARTTTALQAIARQLSDYVRNHPEAELDSLSLSQNSGQRPGYEKFACVVHNHQELMEVLKMVETDGTSHIETWRGQGNPRRVTPLRWILSGEQKIAEQTLMEFQQRFPVFAQAFQQTLDDLGHHDALDGTEKTFAALYAVGRLLMAIGVQPELIKAEGLGVWVAACLVGNLQPGDVWRMKMRSGQNPVGNDESKNPSWSCPIVTPEGEISQPLSLALDTWNLHASSSKPFRTSQDVCVAFEGLTLTLGSPLVDPSQHRLPGIKLIQNSEPIEKFLQGMAQVVVAGVCPNFAPLFHEHVRKMPLPTYPFERKDYRVSILSGNADEQINTQPNTTTTQGVHVAINSSGFANNGVGRRDERQTSHADRLATLRPLSNESEWTLAEEKRKDSVAVLEKEFS